MPFAMGSNTMVECN